MGLAQRGCASRSPHSQMLPRQGHAPNASRPSPQRSHREYLAEASTTWPARSRRRSLVKANAGRVQETDGFEDARHAHGGELAGEHWLLPTGRHKTHGGQVVDLVRPNLLEDLNDRQLIEQVRLMEAETAFEVRDA